MDTTIKSMETADSILHFWFGAHAEDALVAQERSSLWWAKNPAADEEIRQRFAASTAMAADGELDGWAAAPRGRLALILLTDQFPRNMYRGTPQSFAFDRFALAWCREGIRLGMDTALRPIERVFFYLPLEHSESLPDQAQAVAHFTQLAASTGNAPDFEGFLDYARRHHDVIARFGRFPHRNEILGRASSPAELAFLQQKGSSF